MPYLKNLFCLAILKLSVKDSFGYNNKIERMGWFWNGRSSYPVTDHGLVYFRVNLKMKKPTLCCFTWIVFVELNFTVAFLLIRKTWKDRFAGKLGDRGFWEIGGNDFEMGRGFGVDTPLQTMNRSKPSFSNLTLTFSMIFLLFRGLVEFHFYLKWYKSKLTRRTHP